MTDADLKRAVYEEALRLLRAMRRDREQREHDEQLDRALQRLGYPGGLRRRRRR